jgi:GH25 family lysozyme M1 (1,4-beta-N-acetylmuramidase)
MADTFDAAHLTGDASLLFDHAAAQAHFGTSVFWLRRLAAWPDEQTAIEFWQVKRDGGRRGIVEVVPMEAP